MTLPEDLMQKYEQLPQTFAGYGSRSKSEWGNDRVGVFEMFGIFIPDTLDIRMFLKKMKNGWSFPNWRLAAATNGKVFYDPLGEFTSIRNQLLNFYPDDVRLKKIAARCMTIAQSGQYNLGRCLKRGDQFSAQYSETKFCL